MWANTKPQAKGFLQAHVKAVEKGHPLAALRAAASRQASPSGLAANSNIPGLFISGPLDGYAQPQGGAGLMGCASWGAYDGIGKTAPEGVKGYSPSGSRGLDSIGQALSAALQVGCCLHQSHQLYIWWWFETAGLSWPCTQQFS